MAGMGDPATLVESVTTPVVTAIPTVIAGEMQGEESLRSMATDEIAEKDKGSVEVIVWACLFGCWVKE